MQTVALQNALLGGKKSIRNRLTSFGMRTATSSMRARQTAAGGAASALWIRA